MNNIFNGYKEEESNDNIKSVGGASVYNAGIHTATGAKVYVYETEWQGTKYTNSDIVITTESGATLTDSLKTTPNSNQTEATTNFLTYLFNIAVVTDKKEALAQMKTQFNALPVIKYTDPYKKEHQAKEINIFANVKFKFMTHGEVTGNANGIFTSQKLTLNQVFRFSDNASLAEIKDEKEPGGSYEYWAEDDFANCKAKTIVGYRKNRDEHEEEVLEVVAEFIADGGKFDKPKREKIQDNWDKDYAKSILSGEEPNTSNDIDDDDGDSDIPDFGM